MKYPDEFQERCLKTWYSPGHELHLDPFHPTLALCGEAGELANKLKKHVYKPDVDFTADEFIDELGDVFYYLAILAFQFGVTIEEVSIRNREKLRDGKNGWPETGQE